MEDKSLEESLTCCFSESVASELPGQDYIPAAAASSLSWLCGAISPEVVYRSVHQYSQITSKREQEVSI